MKIIISSAKKMNQNIHETIQQTVPVFFNKAEILMKYMKSLSYEECLKIWKCSETIGRENYKRFQEMNLAEDTVPAIMSYEGIQYQYLNAKSMSLDQLEYLQKNLLVLSGFYGMLRPYDGIVPYRLDMNMKFIKNKILNQYKNVYEFWGDSIVNKLSSETDCIINLASSEYSKVIQPKSGIQQRVITCVFGEIVENRIVEKGTYAKMARGEMVRYLAMVKAEQPESMKEFTEMGFKYSDKESTLDKFVFIR